MDRVPGIDVSRWQGRVDWAKVAAAGYRFAIIRATIGDDYTDPRFHENWDRARDAGLLTSAYHVVAPRSEPESQMAHFFGTLEGREADFPLCVDVEREDKADPDTITRCVRACLVDVENRDKRKPVIYTARWFWDRFMLPLVEWGAYDLWVASYTSSPILPRDWDTWRFWQYSESGEVPGSGSRATDLNWFAGSYDDLVAYGVKDEGRGADGVEQGQHWRLRVLDKVNVRSGPAASFKDLGDLYAGDVIEALALAGDDVWVEFEPGKWAAFAYKGETFMKLERPGATDDPQ